MQTAYRQSRRRKWKWPKLQYDETGPKTRLSQLDAYPIELPPQVCAMLLWKNGASLTDYGFPNADGDMEDLDVIFGALPQLDDRECEIEDIAHNLLIFRNALPRWSIPIGRNYDRFFLLTFEHGERESQIYTFDFAHEISDDWYDDEYSPENPDRLTKLADNLESFLASLTRSD